MYLNFFKKMLTQWNHYVRQSFLYKLALMTFLYFVKQSYSSVKKQLVCLFIFVFYVFEQS